MMKNIGFEYYINSRALNAFRSLDNELAIQPQRNYLFDLSYLGILEVQGERAIDFLQGQLTCDVRSLSDVKMIQGAQCNLKGRILALMDIISWNGVTCALPKDLLEPTINSLNKTALLSRISLKVNSNIDVFGFYLQNSKDIVPGTTLFPTDAYAQTFNSESCCYHLGNGFYIFLIQSEYAHGARDTFKERDQLLGSLTWHTLRLANQHIDIYPESRGLFLPHRLGLQHTHYVSFTKGCYKGQEIIARMHYKASVKHHMKLYEISSDEKLYSGQKILQGHSGTEIGELVDFSLLGQGCYLVAVSILKKADEEVLFEGHSLTCALREASLLPR